MNIKLVRNATQIIKYKNTKFLVDPFLADKESHEGFPFTVNSHKRSPLVSLPLSIDEIIKDIDVVIVTHTHTDHFDDAAKNALPKDIKIFAQNEKEAKEIKDAGFKNVEVLSETMVNGIKLIKTKAKHGIDDITLDRYSTLYNMDSEASGVIFSHKDEKTLYLTGDTVWYDEVEKVLTTYKPEIIIANAANGQFEDGRSMIMGKEDVLKIHNLCPDSTIIASHMEAVNPTVVTRKELREFAKEKQISNLLIPEDGEDYTF